MAIDCVCPEGDLADLDPNQCKITKLPKVSKMIFQKVDGTNTFVTAVNGIEEAASWVDPFALAATDDKAIITPYLSEVTFGEPDLIEGTENFDGATTVDASGTQLVSATIENAHPDTVAAINSLACISNLGVYIVFSNDRIQSNILTDAPLTHQPILISLDTFVGMLPSREAPLGSKYQYKFQFKLAPDWYENSDVTAAEAGFSYNALVPATV